MVRASKNGVVYDFSCSQWELMPSGKNGWSLISQDCDEEYTRKTRSPYASYGDSGGGGAVDDTFVFTELNPTTTWEFDHGLGGEVNVIVKRTGGDYGAPKKVTLNPNRIRLLFTEATSGTAFCKKYE
jgi:hypothetical protein